jgi:hypothetical protein
MVLVPDFKFLIPSSAILLICLFDYIFLLNFCISISVRGLSPISISPILGFSLMNFDRKSSEVKFLPLRVSF